MKKLLYLFIILISVASCEKDKPDPVPTDTEQTIFIYMPWSTDLLSYFNNNLSDFENAISKGILKNERIVVFLSTSPTEANMFEMKLQKGKNVRVPFKEYANPAITTAGGITSILNDVKTFAPANRYSMIIGCHGLGWIPVSTSRSYGPEPKAHWDEGMSLTRYFGGLSNEFKTDVTTLVEGIVDAGMKMEYILFDDCYMSTVEVAYDLKEVTDYLIASPTEILKHGFPYDKIAQHLVGEVDYPAICEGFHEFYSNYSTYPCGTIGITNCTELDNLANVMREINQRFTFNSSLTNSVQRLDGYTPVIFFDYGDYVVKLCDDPELLSRFKRQLDRVIPPTHRRHTPTYPSNSMGEVEINTYSGITISDPSKHPWAYPKTETAWYKATH